MTPSARKQRDLQQRQALILDVARGMLLEGGYLGLNMDRIAEATGYAKGTIYQHFSCKEEILGALCIDTSDKLAALFERAATFKGRPRERLAAIGEAYDLFVRLYPQHFQSGQIIRSASILAKISPERQRRLQMCEQRCMAICTGVVRDAISQGDLVLPPRSSPATLAFGLWAMAFGAYMIMASDKPLDALGIDAPRDALRSNYHALLDGMGWQPLSHAWNYEHTYERIHKEVFPDEHRQA